MSTMLFLGWALLCQTALTVHVTSRLVAQPDKLAVHGAAQKMNALAKDSVTEYGRRHRWSTAAGEDDVAVLVSGQLWRFLYKESFKNVKGQLKGLVCGVQNCRFDVYVVLSDTHTAPFTGHIRQSSPYNLSTLSIKSIEAFYRSLGAQHVAVRIVSELETEKQLERIEKMVKAIGVQSVGQDWWSRVEKLPDFQHRYPTNGMMFWLRHEVYQNALQHRKYSHFLYVREDNAFVNPTYNVRSVIQSMFGGVVLVDQHCNFGQFSDKIYLADRAGADVLFGHNLQQHVGRMVSWLNHGLQKTGRDSLKTEIWLKYLFTTSLLNVSTFDFARTELRYGDNMERPCVAPLYYKCTREPGKIYPECGA